MEGNLNCNSLCPVYHIDFHISSRSRSPKLLISLRASNWNFVCICNFSSAFLLSHLSHWLSVHHPPAFTNQYHSCSSPVCSFVHPPATAFVFRPNISFCPCSNTILPCLVLWNSNTNTHHWTHLILCNRNCLFTTACKMWIIQEPKKVALWNKRHFEEKNGERATCLKYSVLIYVGKIYKMQHL